MPDALAPRVTLLEQQQFLLDAATRRHAEALDRHEAAMAELRQIQVRQQAMMDTLAGLVAGHQERMDRLEGLIQAIKDLLDRPNGQ